MRIVQSHRKIIQRLKGVASDRILIEVKLDSQQYAPLSYSRDECY
jgi:hypothetical protein